MSSSTDALSAILVELQKMNQRISSIESSKPSAPAAAGKAKKERKSATKSTVSAEDKPKREPTAWRLFADRVRTLLRENGYEGRALGPECVQFASSLKEENAEFSSWADADILARRSAWAAPEVSKGELKGGKGWAKTGDRRTGSKASSVVSGEAPEDAEGEAAPAKKARKNPWEGLSEEQKAERIAKMKAGKAAKKAAAEGASADTEEEASPKPKAVAVKAEEAAPKPSSPKAAEAPKAAPAKSTAAAASAAPAASGQFKPVLLVGVRYLVNMESGHAYYRNEDGSQGDWAGIFSRTPKPHVDTSVPEPGAEEELNFDDE
jgi:hypothetical protein